jgi:hypothetical protein
MHHHLIGFVSKQDKKTQALSHNRQKISVLRQENVRRKINNIVRRSTET